MKRSTLILLIIIIITILLGFFLGIYVSEDPPLSFIIGIDTCLALYLELKIFKHKRKEY